MIKGGTSAAGKCGNLRTKYTQVFLPCQLYLVSDDAKRRIEQNRNLTWDALVKIEDLGGNMVTIQEVSFFQVQKQLEGGIETASITIEKPELWSIWGNTYTEVLRSSNRRVEVFAGFPGRLINIFTGRIVNTVESRGSTSLGAINLTCSDFRSYLRKEESSQSGEETTRYFEIYRLARSAFNLANQMLAISDIDAIQEFLPVGDSLSAVDATISGQSHWSIGAGVASIGSNNFEIVAGDLLNITDDHINYATRGFADASAYNAAIARGLSGGVVVEQEVTDSVDIGKRGKISYPQTVGSDGDDLAQMIVLAQTIIAKSLQGSISATMLYNPYLLPGQIVNIESTRFNIASTQARINVVRHLYRHGDCSTSIDQPELLEP